MRLAPDDPQSVVDPLLRRRRHRHQRGGQRKIERLFYREDFRRSLAGEIGDIGFPARTAEHYTRGADATRSTSRPSGRPASRSSLDYAYGAASFVMPNVLAKLGAEVLAVNPYASTRQALDLRPVAARRRGGRPGHGVGRPPRRRHRLRRRASDPRRRHRPRPLRRRGAAGPAAARSRHAPKSPPSPCPCRSSRAAEAMCEAAGAALIWTKLSTPHLMEVASTPGVDFAASQEGGYIFPGFLPAYDAVATLVRRSGCWPRAASACHGWCPGCPGSTSPTRASSRPGSRRAWSCARSSSGPRTEHRPGRRGQGAPRRRLGPGPARPRGTADPHLGRGGQRRDARVLAQEYARRIRQMLR